MQRQKYTRYIILFVTVQYTSLHYKQPV